jgi:hypothetical protein
VSWNFRRKITENQTRNLFFQRQHCRRVAAAWTRSANCSQTINAGRRCLTIFVQKSLQAFDQKISEAILPQLDFVVRERWENWWMTSTIIEWGSFGEHAFHFYFGLFNFFWKTVLEWDTSMTQTWRKSPIYLHISTIDVHMTHRCSWVFEEHIGRVWDSHKHIFLLVAMRKLTNLSTEKENPWEANALTLHLYFSMIHSSLYVLTEVT